MVILSLERALVVFSWTVGMVGWVDSFPPDLEAGSVPVAVVEATALFFVVGTAALLVGKVLAGLLLCASWFGGFFLGELLAGGVEVASVPSVGVSWCSGLVVFGVWGGRCGRMAKSLSWLGSFVVHRDLARVMASLKGRKLVFLSSCASFLMPHSGHLWSDAECGPQQLTQNSVLLSHSVVGCPFLHLAHLACLRLHSCCGRGSGTWCSVG